MNRDRAQGLTLIELLSTVAIFTILTATALPSLSKQIARHQSQLAANELLQAILLTRQYAVTTNQRVTMAASNGWSNGWEIFLDKNNDGKRSSEEYLISAKHDSLPVAINGNQPVKKYISFVGTGESQMLTGAFQAGTITLCSNSRDTAYSIILRSGGRARIEKTSATNCPALQQST